MNFQDMDAIGQAEADAYEALFKALRAERDGFALTAVEQRALLDEARELLTGLEDNMENGALSAAMTMAAIHGMNKPDETLVGLRERATAWLARAGGENG